MDLLKLLIALAWRNIWRNTRRTLIIVSAMAIGVWSMVIMVAFMRGISVQIVDDAIDNLTGHIQIHNKKYRDDPAVENSMPKLSADMIKILQQDEVASWSTRVRVPAVVSSERETTGVFVVGIDAAKEKDLSFIGHTIKQGRYLQDHGDKGIIIGKKLAERLETDIGKRIVLMSQKNHGGIADRGFRVVGLFDTKLESVETTFVFVDIKLLQEMLEIGDVISEVGIKMNDISNIDLILKQLREQSDTLDIQPWNVLEPLVETRVKFGDGFAYIWYIIVFIAMGFGLINTLLMAIFERTREFGLFQALGLKSNFIIGQIFFESVFLLILAILLGNFISWLNVLFVGDGVDVSHLAQGAQMAGLSNVIPLVVTPLDLLKANIVVIGLGMLASLYPAWRASRYVPVDAITRN